MVDHARAPRDDAEVAERRRAAENLLEEAFVAIATFQRDRTPILVNAAWRRLFGADARMRAAAGAPDSVAGRLDDVLLRQRVVYVDGIELRPPARLGYCSFAIAPLAGDDPGILIACVDTTEETAARLLSTSCGHPLWCGNADGVIDRANEAWYGYVGRALSSSWLDPIHPDDRSQCMAAMRAADQSRALSTCDARIRRIDGKYRWHDIRCIGGMREGSIFAAAVDNHDAHEADDTDARETQVARRLKDKFLAAVSHELRAPLTTMLLWEKVLRDESADAELRQHALDAIHQSALVQSRLVGDLLDVARATSGKLYVDLRPLDVSRLLEEAIDAIGPAMAAKPLRLELSFEPSLRPVDGDAVRLRQVFDNMLSNALKFTDAGGTVRVSTRAHGRTIQIEIADTGRGISAEFLPRVFEPFTQLDDPLTRSQGGLGLGLAIARELVTLHHGSISVMSPGIGQGATFTVTLPVLTTRRTRTPPPRPRHLALDHVRILVVDDDHRVRAALGVLLRRAGATVETAESAQAARDVMTSSTFDIVICDIAMPGEDGYAFVRGLRESGNELPVIALTAYAGVTDERHARDAGFNLHIAKPVDFDRLVMSVQSAIDVSAARSADT